MPPDVSDGVAAWLALEAFHEKIGIDELDDYIISAYDPKTNIVLEQADDDEIPSGMSAQYCGLLSEDLDDLLLIEPFMTEAGEINWKSLAYDLAGSLDACTTQIGQMQAMFDDGDGTIAEAVRSAAQSTGRFQAAHSVDHRMTSTESGAIPPLDASTLALAAHLIKGYKAPSPRAPMESMEFARAKARCVAQLRKQLEVVMRMSYADFVDANKPNPAPAPRG